MMFFISLIKILFQGQLNLSGFNIVYLNGNKAAFYYFISHFFKKNKKIIWHLRDYFSESFLIRNMWKFLIYNHKNKIKFICNSYSVEQNLKKTFSSSIDCEVIYNPSGLLKNSTTSEKFETIGVVSMLTPWKGVHEVYFFAWLYEEKLKALGVKKIRLYGDNVYETKGDHSNYKDDLKKMIEKMPTDLIEFAGLKNPETIYAEIDCLIHYSIRPEPFGRVIVEAFATSVPVITTGLGGAGEIVENGVNGFKTILFDREDLFKKIENLKDFNIRKEITRNGLVRVISMEKEIENQMLMNLE
jgi:glycosyltransferase involved in cell wall biosynthesis